MGCQRPDRDVPKLKCGHPLPCPYHTLTIDLRAEPVAITEPLTAGLGDLQRRRIVDIAEALDA